MTELPRAGSVSVMGVNRPPHGENGTPDIDGAKEVPAIYLQSNYT